MTEPGTVDEFVVVDADQVEDVARAAGEHGVQVEHVAGRGLEPVSTVTLLLVGAVTAVATVARVVDEHKGGQVVDLRPGSPRPVYRSRDVVYGLVVVITRTGSVTVEVHEPTGMFGTVCASLVSSMTELAKAGTDEVAKKIECTFGPGEVSVHVGDETDG